MKKNTHGGERVRAGRKKLPPEQRRVMLMIYPKVASIKNAGGAAMAKFLALKAIEPDAKIAVKKS